MILEALRQGTDYYADQQLASCAVREKKAHIDRQPDRQDREGFEVETGANDEK
jgi:hypothetical protein